MTDEHKTEDPLILEAPKGQPSEAQLSGKETLRSEKAATKEPKKPLGKRLLRFLLIVLAALLALFVGYRWAGTSTVRGIVQRVYEEEARQRIEFVSASGDVLVFENEPINFPHFKTDTTDLQAKLHRYAETGDIVDVSAWGLRASWFSVFPNAIDVEFIRSDEVRKKQHVDRLTQTVIDELIDQGVVERGEASERMRPGLQQALEKGMNSADSTDADEAPEKAETKD